MCILCPFIQNWEKRYDGKKYPLIFYRHFLEQTRKCQNEIELFKNLFILLHWKLGRVREGTGDNNVIIDNRPFNLLSIESDFEQYRNDIGFLQHCFQFRNGEIEGYAFFRYIREKKQIFGRSLVLHVFLMHSLRPEDYPMIDQHVWRTMRVFHAETRSINQKPITWNDYERYRTFFNNVFIFLRGENHLRFDRHTIDRAFMSFGKWIKEIAVDH